MSVLSVNMSTYIITANKGATLRIESTVYWSGSDANYGITCTPSDPSIISVESIALKDGQNNVHVITFKVIGVGRCYLTAASIADPSVSASTLVIANPVPTRRTQYMAKTFAMPSVVEVERGQRFDVFARGLQEYAYNDMVTMVSYDGTGAFNFVPTSNQLELISSGWDTLRTRGQFRAGNIPGTYTINVVPTEHAEQGYVQKTITVNVVDKIFNNPFEQIYPSLYYICFTDVDEASIQDINAGYAPNPVKIYFSKATNGEATERFSQAEMDDIGWNILHDGVISRIERDGRNLKIYRGSNYGTTQVIFYLKSNPHIFYPVWVEYLLGQHSYYYDDGGDNHNPQPVDPDDPTPIDPDDPTPVDPVQDGDDIITYIKRVGDEYVIEKQYVGNLNFKTGGFFDSIVDYETDDITKVYWVDGVNQPRVITLQEDWSEYDDTSFDFVPEIDKFPHVYIEKEHTSGAGIFKAGVVQYFFTYSNIHGVETAVVYSSPLFYADHKKRAGAPDDFVECQFNISISNLSDKFDKINVYRAIRTSVDTEVEMLKIANIDITGDSVSIIDDYVGGQSVSPTDLFYKGGDRFVAGTLAAKDNTLFLGNIDIDIPDYDDLGDVLHNITPVGFGNNPSQKELTYIPSNAFLNGNREVTYTQGSENGNIFHSSNSYLKAGDYYNIGVQLQDKFGKWSEPIAFNNFLQASGRPSNGNIPKQSLSVDISNIDDSIKNKYERIRAVVCFPDENKRSFIAQGVLNPTVYCTKDRNMNMPYAVSSWFFRSIPPRINQNPRAKWDTALEYRHDAILGYNTALNCEAQFMNRFTHYDENAQRSFSLVTTRLNDVTSAVLDRVKSSNLLAIDSSICTLNSPDITDIGADSENCNVSIVGYFNTDKVVGEYNISLATTSELKVDDISNITSEKAIKAERTDPMSTWPLYFDAFAYFLPPMTSDNKQFTQNSGVAWAVYPWQADRPLGNDYDQTSENQIVRGGENPAIRGQYSQKVLGNIRYCNTSEYFQTDYEIQNISEINYYRGTASNLVRFSSDTNNGYDKAINFYTGLDEVFTANKSNDDGGWLDNNVYLLRYSNGVDRNPDGSHSEDAVTYSDFINGDTREMFDEYLGDPNIFDAATLLANEPTLIRYKSTPHVIFRINPRVDSVSGKYIERVLPGYMATPNLGEDELASAWIDSIGMESAIPSLFDPESLTETDRYWIGELTRSTPSDQMFPLDVNDRNFIPISDIYDFKGTSLNIELYGDIHYQRWDCLKTYPYSYDDKNQVIDVLSFMVESKINLDGRYDKYVETEDVTSIDDSFFNKMNDVYNQKDNFFTYHIQESWIKENNDFPNQFTWSQTKHPGSEIDIWTSVNLASTYQVDGTLGQIRKLIKFGDTLFCFQDKGISQIMFNSNIQLASTSGVPIELANSGKVDGVRYITNMEGSKNPWTIKSGLTGIFFVDDINHSLDKLSASGIDRLSETKGFSDFVHRNHEFRSTWYDKDKKDVHFVTGDKTLCYSEKMGEFTSFYDYGRANISFNVGDNWNQLYGNGNKLFTARKGDYFYFFDDDKPSTFSITYRVAPQPFNYKIFNTVDYLLRVNSVDGINHDLVYDCGFHEISVSTENGDVTHKIDTSDFIQNMNQIKKFNIWRTNIPRFDYFRRADGTSMYLCLRAGKGEDNTTYSNVRNKRYELHNLKISYLS